jgi:hypothetical protein
VSEEQAQEQRETEERLFNPLDKEREHSSSCSKTLPKSKVVWLEIAKQSDCTVMKAH